MKPLLLVLAFTIAVAGASAVGYDTYNINWTANQSRSSGIKEGIVFTPLQNVSLTGVCVDQNSTASFFQVWLNGTGVIYAANLTGKCGTVSGVLLNTGNQYGIQFGHTTTWTSVYWTRGGSVTNTITGSYSRVFEGLLNETANDYFYNIENMTFDNVTTLQNLTITAKDLYYNTSINSFNATVTGTSEEYSLVDKSGNGNNLTNNGSTWNSTSKSYSVDGVSDYLNGSDPIANGLSTFTFSTWITWERKTSGVQINQRPIDASQSNRYFIEIINSTGRVDCSIFSSYNSGSAVVLLSENTLYHLACQLNGTHNNIFINGVLVDSFATTPTPFNTTSFGVNYGNGGTRFFKGNYYSVAFWNRSLSPAEVATVYANGSVTDGLVALYDFSGYGTFNYTTTNGTINTLVLINATQKANATTYAAGYYESNYTEINETPLTTYMYQSVAGFTATEIGTGDSPGVFTVTSGNQTSTGTNPTLYLPAGNVTVTFNKTGWFNTTFTIQTTAQTSATYNLEGVHRYLLNITANNSITGATQNNFQINAVSGSINYSVNVSTTSANASIPWFNDTNLNLTILNADNIASSSVLLNTSNLTSFPATLSYRFSGFTTNSLFITFVDEETGSVINGTTINAYITGTIVSYNYTTNNGYLNATLLNPQNYTITYGGGNYNQREYNVEITNQTFQFLVLYLLNNNTGTYIRFTVLDQTYQTLEGAAVNAQKKNLSGTNYFTVADCTTDNNGECILFLETLTTTYRFVTDYQTTTRTTSDTILSRDTYTIVLNTGTSTLQQVLDRDDIVAGLNYTAPGSFYYTVDDSTNNVQTGLLVVERRYGGRLYPVSSSTTSGSSFTLSVTGVNTTLGDEIIASGYVYVDGQPILTHRVSVIESSAGTAIGGGLAFLFLGMMFTIVFIFAWNPVAPLVAFGAFVIIMSRIGIISMGGPAVVAVIIVLGVAIYRMRSV